MTVSIGLTEMQVFDALRTFLIAILPAGTEVVRGQVNRVPQPAGADFVVMWSLFRRRLATNVETGELLPGSDTKDILQPTELTVQLDVHGPASGDNAQIVATLLRDNMACESFTASGIDAQPLYASDPRQMAFIDAELQYENRWTIDAVLQINPQLTVPQDYAGEVDVVLLNVDVTYPPARGQYSSIMPIWAAL